MYHLFGTNVPKISLSRS